jgi:hypothetical protein
VTWYETYVERGFGVHEMKLGIHSYQDYETGMKTPLRAISFIITAFLDPM